MSTQDSLTRVATMLTAAILLAACGTTEKAAATIHTQEHPQLGSILVDKSGQTLYFTDQEADGTLLCVDECLQFWFPAEGQDATSAGVPALDVRRRADNAQDQLTYQGKPLYTFRLDKSSGDAKGNGVEDDFAGTHFVWHAATIGATSTSTTGGGDYGGGGY